MADYTEKFHWLSARTRTNESENYQIAHFVGEMKDDIQEQMDLQLISTLWAAIYMAYKAKIKLDKRQKGSSSKKHTWDKYFTSYQ